ncbi:MAG: acyltransferase domain-containing protein [Oscillospiraceae bacterium]
MKTIYTHLKKNEITTLCQRIDMPVEVTELVCGLIDEFDFSIVEPYYHKLFGVATGGEGVNEIDAVLKTAENKGFVWLTIYLAAALETKSTYDEMGIDEVIFYDTMAIFTRFVHEHKNSFGVYGYDRHWWNYRQIACSLFRVGVLEYEMYVFSHDDAIINGETVISNGENVISIHIPSDARLTPELCKASLKAAVGFFETYWPSFEYRMLFCHSWIISPNLKQVLAETSNIVKFLELFEIYSFNPDSEGYKLWVFKNDNLRIDEFPQDTSLQRNIVTYLRQGGKIGEAGGIIRKTTL